MGHNYNTCKSMGAVLCVETLNTAGMLLFYHNSGLF